MADFEFTIESAGGRASKAQLGPYSLHYGKVPDQSGDDSGPGPLAHFIASAGACAHFFVTGVFLQHGLEVDDVKVVVRAHSVPNPNRLDALSMDVILPAGTSPAVADEVSAAVKRCPVHGTLTQPPEQVPVKISVQS